MAEEWGPPKETPPPAAAISPRASVETPPADADVFARLFRKTLEKEVFSRGVSTDANVRFAYSIRWNRIEKCKKNGGEEV